jgi:Uncharacterised protein family (UPF0220)
MEDSSIIRRNQIFALVGGFLFGAGWWIFIDGYSYGNYIGDATTSQTAAYAWVPLFGATIAYVMLNGMKWSDLKGDFGDESTAVKTKIFLLFTILIAFGCIAGSAALMQQKFLAVSGAYNWAGISVFVGTMVILCGAFLQRFGTIPPSE